MTYVLLAFAAAGYLGAFITAQRCDARVDALLERISTSPKLELQPLAAAPQVDTSGPKYIPDTPEGDGAWNEYRGVPDEDEVLA